MKNKIREVKETIYKKLESFIGTKLDNTDEYRKYRKIVLNEWKNIQSYLKMMRLIFYII